MFSTLKRTHPRELTLNHSCTDFVRADVRPSDDRTCEDKYYKEPSRTHHHNPYPKRAIRTKQHRYTHPIHSLPLDLLAHIFVVGSSLDVTFPMSVSHVCGAWRDLALHTPSLWRRITLNSNTHYRLDMWRERIYRAKACPLDIKLGAFPSHSGKRPRTTHFDVHTVQWYMHLVLPSLHRWRSIHISFPHHTPFLWNAALSACCGAGPQVHAPLLEELSLVYPANDDTKVFTLFGGVAPRLRRLVIDGIRLAWLPPLFCNLTFLDYTHRGPARGNQAVALVLDMLEISSRLRELRISFSSYGASPLPGHARVHARVSLRFLNILRVSVDSYDIPYELYTLLPNLNLPFLTSLHLLDNHHSLYTFQHLGPFLEVFRPPPSLKYLWMEKNWVDHRVLPSLFHSLRGLRRALVSGTRIPDSYYVGFVVREQVGTFVFERAA